MKEPPTGDRAPDGRAGAAEGKFDGPAKTSGDAVKLPRINGPIGISSAPMSDEARAQTLALISSVLGNPESWPRAAEDEPAPREDSNITIGARGKTRPKLDDLLAQALRQAGYKRVAKLTYRADWSTPEVEHILTFDTYGRPKQFLIGDIGLRNRAADAFAEECQRRYADPVIRRSDFVPPPWWCWMHGSLGMLANWKGSNLNTPDYTQDELLETVAAAVRDYLTPYVGGVTTIERLYHFLAQDTEPIRWFRTGPHFRAAEVAFLGRKVGVAPGKLEELLSPHQRAMKNNIDATMFTPEEYIARIIQDAGAAVGAALK
jgi:hypothetical protein